MRNPFNKRESPVLEYRTIIRDSGDQGYVNRLLVATPTTGLVRMEWVQGRYGQIIPVNWSHVQMMQFLDGFIPLRYQVADAQNIIVQRLVEMEMEWLLFIEHDVILPPDSFIRFNEYMRNKDVPVVSGLYYTRSRPCEPLVFRGRGTSFYSEWEMGEEVWVDGVPTGCLLIHAGILRKMWEESPEYMAGRQRVRRVFDTPRKLWFDPESQSFNALTGTSDLEWCTRVIEGKYLEKAGWDEYQEMEYPFLVDTKISCKHINANGEQFP